MHLLALRGRLPNLLWIIPAVIVAGGICLPLVYLLVRAVEGGPETMYLFLQPQTYGLFINTIQIVVVVVVGSLVISLPLAWLTTYADLPGRWVLTVLAAVPLVIPSYVGAYAFIAAFGPRGMLQQILVDHLGWEYYPDIYGFLGASVVLTLFTYPYLFIALKVAFLSIDPALEEASRSLGFNRLATFWRITLPQLKPAIAAGGLLVALYTISDFGAVSMLQYDTFTRAIYIQYQAAFSRSYAAALALVLVLLSIIVLYFEVRMRTQGAKYYRIEGGPSRNLSTVNLGSLRWPAFLFCGGTISLALGIPTITIAYWLIRGVKAGETLPVVWTALVNSLSVSTIAAIVALVSVMPIVLLSVRSPSKLGTVLDRLMYIGFALPGVAIALGLVFFGANYANYLYQTLTILIFAYTVQFLPLAGSNMRSALLRVSPRLEEAAKTLGRNSLGTFISITLPLARPGVLGALAIVFLSVMKELPITLILSPTGFQTLATVLWGAMDEGFFARAAVPALLLIVISSLSLAGILNRFKN